MKQIGLTLTALVLVVTTALPASALPSRASARATVPSSVTFSLTSIPGANSCC